MEASGPHHDMTEPAEGGEGGVMEPTVGGEGGLKCHGCDRLLLTDRQKNHYRLILIDNNFPGNLASFLVSGSDIM